MYLDQLKNLDFDKMGFDEMISMSAFGKSLAAEYEAQKIKAPEWLEVKMSELKREIGNRLVDEREKRKRELRGRLKTLQTAEEKRAELRRELEDLEKL